MAGGPASPKSSFPGPMVLNPGDTLPSDKPPEVCLVGTAAAGIEAAEARTPLTVRGCPPPTRALPSLSTASVKPWLAGLSV